MSPLATWIVFTFSHANFRICLLISVFFMYGGRDLSACDSLQHHTVMAHPAGTSFLVNKPLVYLRASQQVPRYRSFSLSQPLVPWPVPVIEFSAPTIIKSRATAHVLGNLFLPGTFQSPFLHRSVQGSNSRI